MSKRTLKPGKQTQAEAVHRPRYIELWERIRVAEAKLDAQEAQNNHILREFATSVRPLEESLTDQLCGLIHGLMQCFHDNEDDANRSLLGFWIIDLFKMLNRHPFADADRVHALFDAWRLPLQGTEDMVASQLSLLMASQDDLPGRSRQRANYPDADMFAKHASHHQRSNKDSRDEDSSSRSDRTTHHNAHTTNAKNSTKTETSAKQTAHSESTHSSPFKPTSRSELGDLFNIHKLFRRIANAVHPDREQDENRKAEKHELMSTCLQARDAGDVAKLLSLYAAHVGDLPSNWSDESTGELVTALEKQLRQLELRGESLQSNDPLLQLIIDRYLGYDTQDVTRRIQSHKLRLQAQIDELKNRRIAIKSDAGLTSALQERRNIELDKLELAELTNG